MTDKKNLMLNIQHASTSVNINSIKLDTNTDSPKIKNILNGNQDKKSQKENFEQTKKDDSVGFLKTLMMKFRQLNTIYQHLQLKRIYKTTAKNPENKKNDKKSFLGTNLSQNLHRSI